MTPLGTILPGSWWFGTGSLRWPTASASDVSVGRFLELTPLPDGPDALDAPNGTLGGLVVPPTVALEDGAIWMVDARTARLLRYDAVSNRFLQVAGFGAGSSGAHRFGRQVSIAAIGGSLLIADRERTDLVIVATRTLAVRARLDMNGHHPASVAAHGGRFYILDDSGAVHRSTRSLSSLEPCRLVSRAPRAWSRIIVDHGGRIWLLDDAARELQAFEADGSASTVAHAADDVRELFDPPAMDVDWQGRFQIPEQSTIGESETGWFDRFGDPTRIAIDEGPGPARFATSGMWTSTPLDSRRQGCRWHRLVASRRTPPGCSIGISTYASDDEIRPEDIPLPAWSRQHHLVGNPQPKVLPVPLDESDVAVLSQRGRYLCIRVELRSDGWAAPSLNELLVEPERPGPERFLPATYRSDEPAAEFTRRYLAIFGAELDEFEQKLRSLPTRFSPTAVPDRWLNDLAAELGVPLEGSWSAAQRRRLLDEAPRHYSRRGTPAALRALLHTHLEASSDRTLPDTIPVVVEGFRERIAATFGCNRTTLGNGPALPIGEVAKRPRLGAPGYVDRIQLITYGEQQTDRFRAHANRFKVFVPGPLVPDSAAAEAFERLVVAEKPAHVAHEIFIVEPRTTVGRQCSLGIDTYVGAVSTARLVRQASSASGGTAPIGPRLGAGLRLGRRRCVDEQQAAVGRGALVGAGALLM